MSSFNNYPHLQRRLLPLCFAPSPCIACSGTVFSYSPLPRPSGNVLSSLLRDIASKRAGLTTLHHLDQINPPPLLRRTTFSMFNAAHEVYVCV